MNVREWIEVMSKLNPEALVVLAKDEEGNAFSPLAYIEPGYYTAETTWSGEFFTESNELPEEPGVPDVCAVALWPIN
ncbi:hypothetical protein ACFU44_00745 [Nocardia rhizosphaerihabitans]|uniref:hypothetical protein n=1 Tax=Nocardia rhizosphaerihabitans TaxID=1691570 RepID=UPI00366E019B